MSNRSHKGKVAFVTGAANEEDFKAGHIGGAVSLPPTLGSWPERGIRSWKWMVGGLPGPNTICRSKNNSLPGCRRRLCSLVSPARAPTEVIGKPYK
jgi:hypothetical protein